MIDGRRLGGSAELQTPVPTIRVARTFLASRSGAAADRRSDNNLGEIDRHVGFTGITQLEHAGKKKGKRKSPLLGAEVSKPQELQRAFVLSDAQLISSSVYMEKCEV